MQSKNKKLAEYFKAAKLQEPAVSLKEVQAQLQHIPSAVGGSAGISAASLSAKMLTLLFTGIIGAASVGMLFWAGTEQQPLTKVQQPIEGMAVEEQKEASSPVKEKMAVAASDTIKASIVGRKAQRTGKLLPSGSIKTVVKAPEQIFHVPLPSTPPGSVSQKLHNEKQALTVSERAAPVFDHIKLVELPKETLERLQIQVSPEGIFYHNVIEDATNSDGKSLVLQLSVVNNEHQVILSATTTSALSTTPFLPVFISERSGKQRVAYRLPHETKRKFMRAYFNEMINSLVPVLVKANNAAKDEVILWFEPTPAFLNLLPLHVSSEIDKEYKQLLESRDATKQLTKADSSFLKADHAKPQPDKEAAKGVASDALLHTSYKYFESGVSNLTTIKYAVVYPNPATEYVKLTIGLKRDETLRVGLVDINGRLVKVLSTFKPYQVGTNTAEFSLRGIFPGLYLVVTETKSGSRLSQRIIIQ